MGRRRRKSYPLLENIEVVDLAAEGKAIAKVDELIVFIQHAVPGDVVDIQITNKRRNYMEGYPVKYHKYSKDRVEAFCSHFGVCGGCKWQQLPYEKQKEYKQQQVADNLQRIGKVQTSSMKPIMGAEKTRYYRNKLEYTFSAIRWLTNDEMQTPDEEKELRALGFHIPKMFDKIVDIKHCYLQAEPSNKIRLMTRDFCIKNDYSFYNSRKKEGYMRNLIIRTSSTGETMVIVVFGYHDEENQSALLNYLKNNAPEITSLLYVINQKLNDTITDLPVHLWHGREYIFEEMERLKYKIGAKSFYQTNSQQAYQLYKIARNFAQLSGNEIVYDLYTGTGTIANFIAGDAKKVIGVEYIPEAIEDANENSSLNGIDNTHFFAGDMKDLLTKEFIEAHGTPDVIITDPPRAGMHPKVVQTILNANPKRIVYVSCNPATQARDIQVLSDKYQVTEIQPVDMFPHTHHVENVVLLQAKSYICKA